VAPAPPPIADVVVVGGGPAGAAAAITLAEAGRDVLVIDKATFPRDKTCGDGLTTGALRHLERLGLDPGDVPSWTVVDEVVIRDPGGRETAFPLPVDGTQHAVVARRAELDAALLDRARAAGASVHEGHAVTGVDRAGVAADDPRSVVVTVAGLGSVRARYVVAADGMWSLLRRALGLDPPGYRGDWHAFRQYVAGVSDRARRELFVSFEPDLVPGYLWSFPVGGGAANIGFGIPRLPGVVDDGRTTAYPVGAMGQVWADLLARPHVRALLGPAATPEGPHRAWPIPSRVGRMTPARGRVLLVGDALAATDPMTGEGIGQALATGAWAAEAVLGAGALDPGAATRSYARRVAAELVPDDAVARFLVRALRHRRGVSTAVRVAGATDWTRRNFARWLFEDYPRAIAVTPTRWRRGRLHADGAYGTRTLERRPPTGVRPPDPRGSSGGNVAATLPR
jgi:geranylgeranyl reductase family protein